MNILKEQMINDIVTVLFLIQIKINSEDLAIFHDDHDSLFFSHYYRGPYIY
jgi:hypothetical protein